ncbi:hypothetical protein EVAR_10937_1 [Eumeta japonica]|uniref:Uncharacterized protein n=1 Tax=Eumeta variegata TaxID=151549 RepID=A0A4C1U628_EUMVA|nr:hypothetical protein EVAR_10937_1 [Eumeta japonica]
MVPEVEDRSKPRISSHTSSMVRLESTHCRQNTPNLKMLDANIPWQRNYKYTSEIISSVLEYCTFYKARLGAVLGRKGLRTPTISKYMKDASKRFFDIAGSHPNARAAVDYQPPHPNLSVGHETVGLSVSQVIDLSSFHPAAANRLRPAGGREPTRDGFCDILCRDDFQASSIAHVTRRRHSHVPSGRTRLGAPAVPLLYGRIGRWSGREIDASHAERLSRSYLSIVPRSRSHARLRRNATLSHAFSCVQPVFIDL